MIEIKYLSSAKVKQLNCQKVITFSDFKVYTDGVNKMVKIAISNLFKESLTSVKFKITQYDVDNNRLKREIKTLDSLAIRHKKTYETEDLSKVDVLMDHIDVEVLAITYITVAYENGTMSSTFVKQDKALRRHLNKVKRKINSTRKHKIRKKDLKEVVTYSTDAQVLRKGMVISVLCGVLFVLLIVLMASFICKLPSAISNFGPTMANVIKGGLF